MPTQSTKKLLLEDTWEFRPNRKSIVESKRSGSLIEYEIPGTLSICDKVNGNGRRYKRPVWEKNFQAESKLMQMIRRNGAFGQLEHPADGMVDLRSPISHRISSVKLEADGTVTGSLTVLSGPGLPDGQKLQTLIESGYDPLVSSRGYGSVIRSEDGIDDVQDDYICEGWDVVSVPSFVEAQLQPTRENLSKPSKKDESLAVVISEIPNQPQIIKPRKSNENIMDINSLRSSVTALRSVNILKSSQRMIAESFSLATSLHRQISEIGHSNPSLSWDATSLNEELSEIESGWFANIQTVMTENKSLKSDREKLLQISENLTKTTKAYRKQLTETFQKYQTVVTLFETAQRRGRGWYQIAETRKQTSDKFDHQLEVATTAVGMLAEQLTAVQSGKDRDNVMGKALESLGQKYHRDTTRLARAVFEVKYPAEAVKPDIKKKLDEAKTAEDILKVRNEVDPEAAKAEVKPVTESVEKGQPAPITEGKENESKPAPVTESKVSTAPAPVQEGIATIQGDVISVVGPTLDQAVGMSKRLSKK